MELFKTYLPDLLELKNEPFYDRGILPTEAFAFISYCKELNIECIIESGTAFGQSCYLFAKYLGMKVYTIDIIGPYGRKAQDIARSRCRDLPVEFLEGNSNEILPKLLSELSNKSIAVFIDGPKGTEAINLKDRIWNYESVKMVGIHDLIGENITGQFSSANNSLFINTYQDMLDSISLSTSWVENPTQTMKEKFPYGQGICIWHK